MTNLQTITTELNSAQKQAYLNDQPVQGLPFIGYAKAWIGGEVVEEIHMGSTDQADLIRNLKHWAGLQADEASVEAKTAEFSPEGDIAYDLETIW